jgi:hypothetical protein
MHANGGYKGLARVVNWLNLKAPTLLLDVRKRDSYEEKASEDSYKAKASHTNSATLSSEGENATSGSAEKKNMRLVLWKKLFAEAKRKDYEFYQKMLEQHKVDLFEVCWLSHLHTLLAPKSKVEKSESLNLHSTIQKAYEETKDNGDDKPDSFVWQNHAEPVTEYLLETEFRAYWEMKPNSEKKELAQKGIVDAQAPLGLLWEAIGATRPTEGNLLSNESLQNALGKKLEFSQGEELEFSQDEWNDFKITEIRDIDFIKSGDQYFRPVQEGQKAWKLYFKDQISEARAVVHAVLTHELTYSCHVNNLDELNLLINFQMMDNGGLPLSNNLEGLLVLRSAWDIVDIANDVIRGYKLCAKLLYLFIIILSIVPPCIVVFSKVFECNGKPILSLVVARYLLRAR